MGGAIAGLAVNLRAMKLSGYEGWKNMQKVLIISENEEKYRRYYEMMAGRMDANGILRSKGFDEAKNLVRNKNVDFLVMEPKGFLNEEISMLPVQKSMVEITGNTRQDLDYVRSYIFAHYAEKLTLKTLSSLISVTPNHLCHVFRKAEGIGIREFVEKTRLERAAALLCGTDDPVFAVARRVGFQNNSYFCQRFRETYGITPRKYRLAVREA